MSSTGQNCDALSHGSLNRERHDRKRWHKAWSSWSGMKTAASVLHLDDLNSQAPESSERDGSNSKFDDYCEVGLNFSNSLQKVSSGDSDSLTMNHKFNIQEHIGRLQQYSDLCERASRHLESENPRSPLGWVHRFKNRELDVGSDVSQGGSFLSSHSGCISPPLRPAISTSTCLSRDGSFYSGGGSPPLRPAVPTMGGRSKDGSFRRRNSSPSTTGRAVSASPRAGGDGVHDEESAVYRRQVASALKDGRTVWI